MRIFISGGCKNGKSSRAQELAVQNAGAPLYYIATMKPGDEEDRVRIQRHIDARQGLGFVTIETPMNIETVLTACDPRGSFLLDSTTALLSNEMFAGGAFQRDAAAKMQMGLSAVLRELKNIVVVSDFIYADALFYDEWTEAYRKALAGIDRLCADACDVVLEAVCGNFIQYKGGV
ncbi:MAG: bifunctional adenosylcobinamide kinase/adenosylcobinamide-phosphate guanylyltransferase [Clostridiales bacterium]|jgi:adenosylcobinamide kinase/adenosylcobinamide-phosphate guanylyltransferase|nr:bifunctional adenosylcobinamide kinase/adenosylcobinamide-phosphate guanylyltransferase [Clostridiales bacterium]